MSPCTCGPAASVAPLPESGQIPVSAETASVHSARPVAAASQLPEERLRGAPRGIVGPQSAAEAVRGAERHLPEGGATAVLVVEEPAEANGCFASERTTALSALIAATTAQGREFLAASVGSCLERPVVRTTGDGEAALRELLREPVELLVLSLGLGDWDGLDLSAAAHRLGLARRIVLCVDRSSDRDFEVLHAPRLEKPWHGCVHLEHDQPEVITGALQHVFGGGLLVSEAMWRDWHQRAAAGDSYTLRLTPAETRVLAYAGSGLDDKAVAEELRISTHTAHAHRKAIMRKLDLRSHAALMAFAVRRGLVRFTDERVLRPGFDTERLLAHVARQMTAAPSAETKVET